MDNPIESLHERVATLEQMTVKTVAAVDVLLTSLEQLLEGLRGKNAEK